jgi:hypothetical protein
MEQVVTELVIAVPSEFMSLRNCDKTFANAYQSDSEATHK